MAINRFYSPQRSQYVSQFVPNQLPTELMMGMLANKQKQEDDKQTFLAEARLVDWNVVPGAIVDEARKKQMINEIHTQADEFATKDITKDPAAFNQYKTFIRGLKNNEEIKAMTSYYDQYTKFQEEYQKMLQDPSKIGGGEAMYKQLREWDESYIKGQGYKGKGYQGLTEVRAAFDIDDNLRETFGALKADRQEWEKLGEFIKTGGSWEGITLDKKITNATKRHFESWRQGPIGKAIEDIVDQQLGLTFAKKQQILSNPESKQEYEKIVNETLYARAMAVGQDYVFTKTGNKVSDRNAAAIKREQDSKALVLAMGMGTTTFDPEAVIENFDVATNNTNAVLKELTKLGVTPPTNLFTTNGAVDQKVYTKLMSDIDNQLQSGSLSPEAARDLKDRKTALEENVYTINTVAINLELGKYKERGIKDAISRFLPNSDLEELSKYITADGKVRHTALNSKITRLIAKNPEDFSKIFSSSSGLYNKTNWSPDDVLRALTSKNKEFFKNQLIKAGISQSEIDLFTFTNETHTTDAPRDIFGTKGVDLLNRTLQGESSTWRKNWKYNKGQEPPTDRIDYGASTEDTREMVDLVKKGFTISVVDPVSGKPFTINSENFPNLNITVSDEVGPDGSLLNLVTTTADDKGTYFNPNTGEMVTNASQANQTIKHLVYMKDKSSLTAMTSSTPDKLISAAQSKLREGNVEEATQLMDMALSQQTSVRGVEGATNLGTYTNPVNFSIKVGETQDIPAIKLNANNTIYNMKGLQVKSVESPTGRISLTLLKNGQPIVTNISNPKSLGHEIEKVAQQEEMRMQTSSGGNLSPY